MEMISKHINDTNASFRDLKAGNAKNTDLFLDQEHKAFFSNHSTIWVRIHKENLTQAILFIASILPRKYDQSGKHSTITFSTDFVYDNLLKLDGLFGNQNSLVLKWNIRTDVRKKNGEIDERFYLNDLLYEYIYKNGAGKTVKTKFIIRDYLAGGYSDIHFRKNDGEDVFDVFVTNATSCSFDDKSDNNEWDETVPFVKNAVFETNYFDYIAAIRTKPLIILGGFSGTGKSRIVRELAFATCPYDLEGSTETAPGNYLLVSVKPNWHDSTDLLGFYSSINNNYFVTPFMKFVVKAMKYEDKNIPFLVCIDEMNLAPVEEYFAEFLSVIESRKKTKTGNIVSDPLIDKSVFAEASYRDDFNIFMNLGLHTVSGETDATNINSQIKGGIEKAKDLFDESYIVELLSVYGLRIPRNLIIVGTVNMDDTTNSFSRKVIDRAMTFETVVNGFDESYFTNENTLSYYVEPIPGNLFIADEVDTAQIEVENLKLHESEKKRILDFMNEINSDLKGSPFLVSYRVLNETILLYRSKQYIEENLGQEFLHDDTVIKADLEETFDEILMQKVLPRIEGDYDKCFAVLDNLKTRAVNHNWKKSVEKIRFMIDCFGNDQSGFTSFWN